MSEPTKDIEEKLAHTMRVVEDLSDIIARQATRIDTLEKLVANILELAKGQAQEEGAVTFGDPPPPHW